jgi:hypothetical protein
MGEQLPVATLDRFVKTALPAVAGHRRYFSRPERITPSYEARRHLAWRQPPSGLPVEYGQTEFFEYHWSYLMTGNKLGDLTPTLRRILLRRPSKVPAGLRVVWRLAWALILILLAVVVVVVFAAGPLDSFTWKALLVALFGEGIVVTLLLQALNRAGNVVTKSFVDVVRYLDRSPRSYAVRREIRKGMVDLLQGLHDKGRYSRVIIVAHSLGAYIAYDALGYLWPQMSKLHAGPISHGQDPLPLTGLLELQAAAERVARHPVGALNQAEQGELDDFRAKQFALWQGSRAQGNPWLVTDFISVGTPMYFADILYTRKKTEFDQLVKSAELPLCPPRDANQTVEGPDVATRHYGWPNQGRTVLSHGCPFAAVRWTNLWFPPEHGWFGDWFGGPLRPLFGKGILDIPVQGNLPGRRAPGRAHSRYFAYPEATGADDVAGILRRVQDLCLEQPLQQLLNAPSYLPETDITR